ncbi:hypothetical protein CL654_00480, partial [bacterium]|nr:hypothetical protein [bacterium]
MIFNRRDLNFALVKWGSGLRCQIGSGSVNVSTVNFQPQQGVWYHFACVHDPVAQTLSLYVDGSVHSSVSATGFTQFQNGDVREFYIGASLGSGSPAGHLNGDLDDFRIYNRAITPGEISQIMGESGGGGGPTQTCGNNVIEGTETCDGTQLNGQSCTTQGFDGGTLS